MKIQKMWVAGLVCMALVLGSSSAFAAAKKDAAAGKKSSAPEVALSAAGQNLEVQYAAQLKTLQAEIVKALPTIDEQQKAAFLNAYQAEAAAAKEELWSGRAINAHHVTDKEAVVASHDKALANFARTATNALAPTRAILTQVDDFLTSDKLDAQLMKCALLTHATPPALAAFAQQGAAQEALVTKLLADVDFMKQMLVADGANAGHYGQAMQIYEAIQKASPRAKDGCLQRLALATSLEHAVPIAQSNPEAATNAPAVVDPVKRYLHYEQAFLDGALDPAFKDLTVWDYRMAVDSDAPDAILAWGREMLRNYRPDQISTSDTRWRYVKAVKTDVKYGSADQKYDSPALQCYQNMINTGGVCGRRAFFGGFILRCFGIPTVKRPQSGHAALAHWTPAGWVINLGAGWDFGWTKYGEGLDFAQHTQARKDEKLYLPVLRAKWVGDVLGETRAFGLHDAASGLWNGVAIYRQRAIVEASKAVALAAVGTDIGEANISKEKDVVEVVTITAADKKIVVGPDGTITIPAVACSILGTNAEKIVFMKSNQGGFQLHYNRNGNAAEFDYTVDAPEAGKYAICARVVTVSPDQHILVTVNDAKAPVDMAAPYTIGMWGQTQPAQIELVKGQNVLRCSRNEPAKGMTIKDFTLTSVK